MNHAAYQLPSALPSSVAFQAYGFDELMAALEHLQQGAKNIPASSEQRHLVDHVQSIVEQGESIKNQLEAIASQLVSCNEGTLSAAHLLESSGDNFIHAGGLLCLLAPLVQRQQDAVNHLAEIL
jgi:hypothetical protein